MSLHYIGRISLLIKTDKLVRTMPVDFVSDSRWETNIME